MLKIKNFFSLSNIGIIIPICLTIVQTWYIYTQNRRIDQQTYLQEADRRASLNSSIDSVLDKVDEELKNSKNKSRELSPLLISRIIALSQSLKPYKYLDGDNLSEKPKSIERGQLLKSLLVCNLGIHTLDKIFDTSDFSYADLSNSNLDKAHLRRANLEFADFSNSQMTNVNLIAANLKNAIFQNVSTSCYPPLQDCSASGIDFHCAHLDNATIVNSDFYSCIFFFTELNNINIINSKFSDCTFTASKFNNARLKSVDFTGSNFIGIPFYDIDSIGNIKPCISFKDTILIDDVQTTDISMLSILKKYTYISNDFDIDKQNPVIEFNPELPSEKITYYKIINKYKKSE